MEATSGSSDSHRCSRGHGPDFVLWWSFQAVLIIKGTTSGTPAAPEGFVQPVLHWVFSNNSQEVSTAVYSRV